MAENRARIKHDRTTDSVESLVTQTNIKTVNCFIKKYIQKGSQIAENLTWFF